MASIGEAGKPTSEDLLVISQTSEITLPEVLVAISS